MKFAIEETTPRFVPSDEKSQLNYWGQRTIHRAELWRNGTSRNQAGELDEGHFARRAGAFRLTPRYGRPMKGYVTTGRPSKQGSRSLTDTHERASSNDRMNSVGRTLPIVNTSRGLRSGDCSGARSGGDHLHSACSFILLAQAI